MMEIIGRTSEIRQLHTYLNSGKPEFIALYGRRRVGKTFLIENFFKEDFSFDVTGVIDGDRSEQMAAFVRSLRKIGYEGKVPKTWMDAFFCLEDMLEKQLKDDKRCVIFIDELPCFDTPKSGFVRALGHFWNSWCQKRSQVLLIVCGSATTWMIKNIIDNHGGLHNRITHEMHLHPFNLCETEQLLQSNRIVWDRLSITQIYMAFGGIPYYLNQIEKGESVVQAIDRLFFSEDATMYNEYNRLFVSLFRDSAPYFDILRILATKQQGISREQILSELGKKDNGHLSDYLNNLIKCDFVRYYFVKTKKIKKTDGLYQLTDFFTIFNNTFLNKPINDTYFWSNNFQSTLVSSWYGLAFERVCMAHIPQIKKALGIDRIGAEYYSWRSRQKDRNTQIDLLIERADRIINLCEIKYSSDFYTLNKDEDLRLRIRQSDFREETQTRYAIIPTLITTIGLKDNNYSGGLHSVITLDDLFVM